MRIVAYYRVSTQRQGESGLGLEAQRAAVETYRRQQGAVVLGEYTEVESGKRCDRVELGRALGQSRRCGATLVIAKLDRLARNVAFVAGLMESGVDFICCDNPHANRLTIHILAAVAEDEARRISERTRAALKAYKARGGLLGAARPGSRKISLEASRRGARAAGVVHRARARESYADLIPGIMRWRGEGLSQQGIADRLNEAGSTTRRGRQWNQVQVGRVLSRYGPG